MGTRNTTRVVAVGIHRVVAGVPTRSTQSTAVSNVDTQSTAVSNVDTQSSSRSKLL